MPYGLFTYAVGGHRIVGANDRSEFVGPAGERLFLSACHPLFSATHRIVVDARLVSAQPLGAALQLPPAAQPAPSPATPQPSAAQRRYAARLAALGSRELVRGTRGKDVKELQRLLGVPSTGFFGSDTNAAVMQFQRTHHLPASGQVGSRTKRLLARRTHPPAVPPTPASVAPAAPPSRTGTGGPSTGQQGRFGGGTTGTTGHP